MTYEEWVSKSGTRRKKERSKLFPHRAEILAMRRDGYSLETIIEYLFSVKKLKVSLSALQNFIETQQTNHTEKKEAKPQPKPEAAEKPANQTSSSFEVKRSFDFADELSKNFK